MERETWTEEQIVDLEEWFLDDRNTGEDELVRRFKEVPETSRSAVRDRIVAELNWRKEAISTKTSRKLDRGGTQKIHDLESKERYLRELLG